MRLFDLQGQKAGPPKSWSIKIVCVKLPPGCGDELDQLRRKLLNPIEYSKDQYLDRGRDKPALITNYD
jgi:hypothetical protein